MTQRLKAQIALPEELHSQLVIAWDYSSGTPTPSSGLLGHCIHTRKFILSHLHQSPNITGRPRTTLLGSQSS